MGSEVFGINEMVEQMMACVLHVTSCTVFQETLRAYRHSADASAVTIIGEKQNANYPQGRASKVLLCLCKQSIWKCKERHTWIWMRVWGKVLSKSTFQQHLGEGWDSAKHVGGGEGTRTVQGGSGLGKGRGLGNCVRSLGKGHTHWSWESCGGRCREVRKVSDWKTLKFH